MEISERLFKKRINALLPKNSDHATVPIGLSKNEPGRAHTLDVSDLLAIIDNEDFLRESYRRILGRECDVPGLVNYLELLQRHIPRRTILLQIMNSEEATARNIRFTGVQGISPPASNRKRMLSVPNAFGRLGAVMRDLVRRILFTRFDSIDHRLNFLLREFATRTDTLAAKTDQSLWSLSEKLDAYVASLSQGQRLSREELGLQSAGIRELHQSAEGVQTQLKGVELLARDLRQELSSQMIRSDQRTNLVRTDLESVRVDLKTLRAEVQSSTVNLQALRADIQATIANVQSLCAEVQSLGTNIQSLGTNVQSFSRRFEEALADLRNSLAAAMEAAKQNTGAILETARKNAAAIAEDQKRALTILDEGTSRAVRMLDHQRELEEKLNSLTSLSANRYKATLASIAGVLGHIRPPVISAGSDVLVTEVDHLIVGVPADEWRMAAYHAFRGPMEPGVTKYFCSMIKPGAVVVDVGANVGIYTLLAARLMQGSGKVYSFEPTPRTYQILKDNVQVNGYLELGLIHLHQLAVTDRTGTAQLSIFNGDCGHNTLFKDDGASVDIEVLTTSLDEILAKEERVDLVKIDAEGAEPLILRGMKRIIKRNPGIRIILEFAPVHLRRAGSSPSAFLDQITSLGFAVRRIDEENGHLLTVTREELSAAFSVNLLLDRSLPSENALE